jgi:hypothetical protein
MILQANRQFDQFDLGRVGFGSSAGLGLTPVYKCTATICYSVDGSGVGNGTDGLFRRLVIEINRFAGDAGFVLLKSDPGTGATFISETTVRAFAKAIDWGNQEIRRRLASGAGWLEATKLKTAREWIISATEYAISKQTLAQGAQKARDALKFAADALALSIVIDVSKPTTTTSTSTPSVPQPSAPGTAPTAPWEPPTGPRPPWYRAPNTAWYAAGGILLLGLGVATYLVWKD